MKKFLALYMAPVESFDKMMQAPKEDAAKGMAAWNEWMAKNKASFVDMGAPVGKMKKVTMGNVADGRNMIGGYSIVQAESLDAAAKIFTEGPHFQMEGGWVEVMECMEMPGM